VELGISSTPRDYCSSRYFRPTFFFFNFQFSPFPQKLNLCHRSAFQRDHLDAFPSRIIVSHTLWCYRDGLLLLGLFVDREEKQGAKQFFLSFRVFPPPFLSSGIQCISIMSLTCHCMPQKNGNNLKRSNASSSVACFILYLLVRAALRLLTSRWCCGGTRRTVRSPLKHAMAPTVVRMFASLLVV